MPRSAFSQIRYLLAVLLVTASFAACRTEPEAPRPPAAPERADVPEWARHAVWYQIFPERFRNADPSNDPTLDDIYGSWPHIQPEGWAPTEWTRDWYSREDWAERSGEEFYMTVQARRYGGDLQGVIDKLDYLRDLGVTALYFNPLNDSPSLHKYDAAYYHHIDRNFGPNPQFDAELMAREDPADPATWVWTSADSLFLQLIQEVRRRDMRIVMDYSWNHTGIMFWAFRDVVENQRESEYAHWYTITSWNDPNTEENEFDYEGWLGVRELPVFTQIDVPPGSDHRGHEGNLHPDVKEHVFAVTRRWLDPHGDGDLSKGVDGFRLDVAEMLPLGFWREYRDFVKSINPDAVLIGEIWWDDWPDVLMDPRPWLQGDVFDGIMNYRWYMPTRSFLTGAEPGLTMSQYVAHLDSVTAQVHPDHLRAGMLMLSSHDSPRVSTSLYNPGKYKYRAMPRDNPEYRIERPDEQTRRRQMMLLTKQFASPGAPHIYYGEEVGMWGADDPDNRKPMVWDDLSYEPESGDPHGRVREPDEVRPDTALFRFYQDLIRMRKDHSELFVYGDFDWLMADEEAGVLAFRRRHGEEEAAVILNNSGSPREVSITGLRGGTYRNGLDAGELLEAGDGTLHVTAAPETARIWIRAGEDSPGAPEHAGGGGYAPSRKSSTSAAE